MSDGWMTVLVGIVMVVGLAGTVVPILPGLTVLWGAALAYGFVVGFGPVGITVMALITLLLVVSVVKSFLIPKKMAEGSDVSGWSQLIALVGAVIGFFVVPVVGIVVGALVGLMLSEYIHHRELGEAWEATKAVAKGFGLSALVDIALGVVMITLWAIWSLTVLW